MPDKIIHQIQVDGYCARFGGFLPTSPVWGTTDPIDAVAGMSYEKDKYYRDPTNKEVYICTVSVAYAGLPHEAINVYFNWVRKE